MAFTPAQLLTIGEVLALTPLAIEQHFDVFPYDADTETYVETELTRWATARTKFGGMEAKDRNFGRYVDAEAEKADIRRNIGLALGFDVDSMGGYGNHSLVRS